MKYVGSKNRLSKHLAPFIQSFITEDTKGYFEPFVGGANMIDKIDHPTKTGFDCHLELISLLNYVKKIDNKLPQHISEEEYIKVRDNKNDYPLWYVGLVGFCATYSARYYEGYARSKKTDGTPRDMSNEAIRNIEKQRTKLKDIDFRCRMFETVPVEFYNGWVIYCDIPYRNEKYNPKKYYKNTFDYERFYNWAEKLSKNNIVLISEYAMPEDRFKCVWSQKHSTNISSYKKNGDSKTKGKRFEKVFMVK